MAGSDRRLSDDEQARITDLLARRAAHEPVALITGMKEFWSLPFQVTSATLVPRPDSETLIEAVLEHCSDRQRPWRVLDLGCGSGCLLLSVLNELPNASGLGIDASDAALRVASANAVALGLADRAAFSWGDWGAGIAERFDLILSNPPYITKDDWENLDDDVRLFEPRTALVGGLDGLNPYRVIASQLGDLLAPGGMFFGEVGAGQAVEVSEILIEAGLIVAGLRRDLAGIERCLLATKLENKNLRNWDKN